MLGVHGAAPEHEVLPPRRLQALRLHVRGGNLDRVQDIHPCLLEVRKELDDGAAGVKECLPRSMLVHPLVHLCVQGLVDLAVV